jgi:hypothetical protein
MGSLSTVDLLIELASFVLIVVSKADDLNWIVQGVHLYLALEISKEADLN